MPIPRAYRGKSNAPWNADPWPECECCGEIIEDVEDHTEWCEDPMSVEEIREYNAEPPAREPGGF